MHESQRPPVVLIGSDCITGLQSARIFAGYGIDVIGLAGNPRHPCCSTRACQETHAVDIKKPTLATFLLDFGQRFVDRPVLIPCTDLSVLTLSRFRDSLAGHFRFALPGAEVVEALVDKTGFHSLARSAGLQVPRSWVVQSRLDLDRALSGLRFPCFLKPFLKTEEWELRTQAKVFQIHDRYELFQTFETCRMWTSKLVVQEAIAGEEAAHFTCNCYFDRQGVPQVTFVSRKIRQWPPQVGTGCSSVECRNDAVEEQTLRFFRQVGLRGLGYLEFKRDQRDGKYYLIEPNIGRPTGRSALAEASGVELLWTLYADLTDAPLPAHRVQPNRGVKWIYWRQDLRASWQLMRAGRLSLRDWWVSIRGTRTCPLFRLSDPMPFVRDLLHLAKLAIERTRRPGASAVRVQR